MILTADSGKVVSDEYEEAGDGWVDDYPEYEWDEHRGEPNEYLIKTNYKGHPSSMTVYADSKEELDKKLKKFKAIEAVFSPGDWHYDKDEIERGDWE
jgi:hypothetical protein